jgi:hypothetical protein
LAGRLDHSPDTGVGMYEPVFRHDAEVQLLSSYRQEKNVARSLARRRYLPEMRFHSALDFHTVIAAKAVVSPHFVQVDAARFSDKSDAIETNGAIPALRTESCPDECTRSPGIVLCHRLHAPG